MRRAVRWLAGVATFLAATLFFAPDRAQAYPQWQFSAGATRCNQCHYAPGGGGLLTEYGRDAVGEELSTFAGNGAFLHGAVKLPAYLRLGGDARFAFVRHDNGGPDQPTVAAFPMQADASVRLSFGDFSFQAIGGVRGQARSVDTPIPAGSAQAENANRLVSREHWFAWQPAATGPYVRAGRFFAPFGLRLAEHLVYIRRDLGFNTLQETYNVSAGYLVNQWEAHVTAFGPDFLQAGTREAGAAAYAEYRLLDETAAVAVQSKFASDVGVNRWVAGVVGKLFIERARLLLMTEANYVRQMPSGVEGVNQFVGLLGATYFPPVRGLMVTAWGERWQGDLATLDTSVNAVTGLASWFPYPHVELQIVGRVQSPDGGDAWKTVLAQVHYFL